MYARPSKLVLKESRCFRGHVSKLAQNTQQTSLGIERSPIESWTRELNCAGRKIKTIAGIEEVDEVKKFIDDFGNTYSRILVDKDGTLGVEFGAYGVPETFLIDKNKDIIKKFVGPINKEIVNEIKLIIKWKF